MLTSAVVCYNTQPAASTTTYTDWHLFGLLAFGFALVFMLGYYYSRPELCGFDFRGSTRRHNKEYQPRHLRVVEPQKFYDYELEGWFDSAASR